MAKELLHSFFLNKCWDKLFNSDYICDPIPHNVDGLPKS